MKTIYIGWLVLISAFVTSLSAQNINRPNIQGPSGMEVNSFTGNYFYQRTDLFIPGRGMPLDLSFSYNSFRDTMDWGFGRGWTFPYNMGYDYDSSGQNVIVERRDGRRDLYTFSGGQYVPPVGFFDQWEAYQSGKFRLTTKEGMEYYFDDAGHKRLTSIVDPNGNNLTITYSSNRPVLITNASGRTVQLMWIGNHLAQIIDNNVSPSRSYSYTYDADGYLIKVLNPLNGFMEYAYDPAYGMIQMTDENGNLFTIEYNSAAQVKRLNSCLSTLTMTYTGLNETLVVEKGQSGTQVTSYTFDVDGKVLEQKGNCCGFQTEYAYDAANNVDQLKDANQNRTSFTYDNLGNRISETDADGKTATYTYDPVYNRLTSVIDKNGNRSQFIYDNKGNLTRVDRPNNISESYGYDSQGRMSFATDGEGNIVTFAYNSMDDLTMVTYPIGNEQFTYDGLGNLLTATDANGHSVTYTYDALNRMTTSQDAEGNILRYEYDPKGNLTARIDEDGRRHDYEYDALDRLVAVNTTAGRTEYRYDELGNMTGLINANGHTTSFAYNSQNLLAEEVDAEGNTTTYMYDGKGNLLQKTDANGNPVTYTYDDLDRLIGRSYGSTSDTYEYDAVGNLTRAANSALTLSFSYDANNRLTGKNALNWGKQIYYTYDDVGNRTGMTDPDGGVTSYQYDANNRLTSLSNPFGETTTFTYDNAGRITRLDQANGSYSLYHYDDADRLDSLVTYSSGGGVIDRFSYTYDSTGNRLSMTDLTGTHHYRYDGVSRLDSVVYSDGTTEIFRYDGAGNRLLRIYAGDSTVYTYDKADRLISAGGITYTFDANGNMTSKTDTSGTTTYVWDGLDRLIKVTMPNMDVHQYAYDALGNRILHIAPGGVETRFFWDGDNVLMELNGMNQTTTRYTSYMAMDSWVSMRQGANSYFYHKDGLGSITSLTNATGNVQNTYAYEAFGKMRHQTGAVANPYTYTGRRWEGTMGLYYYRARYYDAEVGRFGSEDIFNDIYEHPLSLNRYTYVENNSLNFIDPTGELFFLPIIGKVVGAAVSGYRIYRGLNKIYRSSKAIYKAVKGFYKYRLLRKLVSTKFYRALSQNKLYRFTRKAGRFCNRLNKRYEKLKKSLGAKIPGGNKFQKYYKRYKEESELARDLYSVLDEAVNVESEMEEADDNYILEKGEDFIKSHPCYKTFEGAQELYGLFKNINEINDWVISIIQAYDPNDITGPAGYGPERWVSVRDQVPYQIRFENDPDFATAPAQEVLISLPFDDNMDPRTFRVGDFGFGPLTFTVPPNTLFYTQRLDARDSLGLFVDVQAGIDIGNNRAFWRFRSIDPATGLPPADPTVGFLAVNDSLLANGEGFVDFTIGMDTVLSQTGDTLSAQANIVFDINPPIFTNIEKHLIDAVAPTLQIGNPPGIIDSLILLDLIVQDDSGGSGVQAFDVFVSENGAPMRLLAGGLTADTMLAFQGDQLSEYCIYSLARDNVNNLRDNTVQPDFCFFVRDTVYMDIYSPMAGQVFCAEDTVNIQWRSRNVQSLDVYYSADSGQTFIALALGLAADDTAYQWALPDSLAGGTAYQIKITTTWPDSTFAGFSDSTFTVIKLAKPIITALDPTAFCQNDSVRLLGPNAFAGYQWTSGDSTQGITLRNSQPIALQVVDVYGCKSPYSDSLSIIAYPLPPQPVVTASDTLTFCDGDSVTLQGPAGYAHYTWGGADTLPSLTVYQSGTYALTVTDSNACVSPISAGTLVTVNALPPQPMIMAQGPTTFCADDSVLLAAPTNYVDYRWSTGSTDSSIWVNTSGGYTVSVIDGNGCESITSASQQVIVNALPPQPLITGDDDFCAGDSTALMATTGYVGYHWSNGDTTQLTTVYTGNLFTVSVIDTNGCESPISAGFATTVYPLPPQPVVTASDTLTFCAGDSVTLQGPTGYAHYTWGGADTLSSLTVYQSGTYALTVTDSNACVSPTSAGTLVTVNALPTQPMVMAQGPTTFCADDSVLLAAPANYVDYRWSTGSMDSSIWVNTSGGYTVSVIDGNGCESFTSVAQQITVNALPPQPLITGDDDFCAGDSTALIATAGYVGYHWSNGDTTQLTTVHTGNLFTVSVIDTNGCESPISAGFATTVYPLPPQPVVTASDTLTFCAGDSVTLQGPAGYAHYTWGGADTLASLTIFQSGTYALTVTDSNACVSPTSVGTVVTVNALPPQPMITGNLEFCAGDTTVLTTIGGMKSYIWSNGGISASIMVDSAVSIYVTVVDSNDCSSLQSDSVQTLINPLPPTPIITGDSVFCMNDSTTLIAPAGFATYLWSNGDTTVFISVAISDTFDVVVTDQKGCSNKSIILFYTVINPLPAKPTITPQAQTRFCDGDSVLLTAPMGFLTYNWSSGDTIDAIWVDASGIFQVSVVDSNQCESILSDSLEVIVDSLPAQPVVMGDRTFCEGDSTTLTGPLGLARYLWSSGDTTASLTLKASDTLTLCITDLNGCKGPISDTVFVQKNLLPPTPTILGDTILCEGDSLLLTAPPGYTLYDWNNGKMDSVIWVAQPGSYRVSVTDQNGCTSDSSDSIKVIQLSVPAKPVISRSNPDSLRASVTGTKYVWTFGGMILQDSTQTIFATQNGTYTVTVYNGPCPSEVSDTFSITTALEDKLAGAIIRVFPNPNNGLFYVKAQFDQSTLVEIALFNAIGQEVYRQDAYARQGRLDEMIRIKGLAAGVYLLRFRVNNENLYKKLEIR